MALYNEFGQLKCKNDYLATILHNLQAQKLRVDQKN